MEDFDLGANFASITRAPSASAAGSAFGEQVPECLNFGEDARERGLPANPLAGENCHALAQASGLLRPDAQPGEVEHSILSGYDCKVEQQHQADAQFGKVSFLDAHVGTAIYGLTGPQQLSGAPAQPSGRPLTTNAINGGCPADGAAAEYVPSRGGVLGVVSDSAGTQIAPDAAAELESLLSPVTRGSLLPLSATIPGPPSPTASEVQMDSFALSNETGRFSAPAPGEAPVRTPPPPSRLATPVDCMTPHNADEGFSPPVPHNPPPLTSPPLTATQMLHSIAGMGAASDFVLGAAAQPFPSISLAGALPGSSRSPPHSPPPLAGCDACGTDGFSPAAQLRALPSGIRSGGLRAKEHACGMCGISFAAKCNLFKHQRAVRTCWKRLACHCHRSHRAAPRCALTGQTACTCCPLWHARSPTRLGPPSLRLRPLQLSVLRAKQAPEAHSDGPYVPWQRLTFLRLPCDSRCACAHAPSLRPTDVAQTDWSATTDVNCVRRGLGKSPTSAGTSRSCTCRHCHRVAQVASIVHALCLRRRGLTGILSFLHLIDRHEQQKNFACDLCGRAFGRRSSLSQHMQRVHKRTLPALRDESRRAAGPS
jgi:Zinc finger, C2H2 type